MGVKGDITNTRVELSSCQPGWHNFPRKRITPYLTTFYNSKNGKQ